MKIKILAIAICSILVVSACSSDKKAGTPAAPESKSSETDVPFSEAKNYFVKNTFRDGDLANPKIASQADFDNIFGMATTMGEQGKPSPIDFSKQYVIVVIGKVTDKMTTMAVNSLKKSGNAITLNYSHKEGEKQTFSMQPFLLLVVDNEHQGEVKIQKQD